MFNIKQSTARDITIFAHDENGDAVTGLSNASFTKRIRKNGGAFAAMTVTITELENGFYEVPLTASHTNTVGELIMAFTNAGCKQINLMYDITARTVDDVATQTSVNTIDTNVDAILVDTGTTLPASIATVDSNVDAILADTGTTIPAQISGLNNLSAAQVNAEVDTALADYDSPTNTEMTAAFTEIKGATWATTDTLEAIRDRGDAAWTTGAGGSAPTAADIRAEIDSNSTQLAAIVADTDELQTDWANGGRLDNLLDGASSAGDPWGTTIPGSYAAGTAGNILGNRLDAAVSSISAGSGLDAAGVRSAIGLSSANLDTQLSTIDSNVDAVLVDTGTTLPATLSTIAGYIDTEIGAIISSLATVDTNVDAILVDTGTTIPAQISGLNNFDPTSDIVARVTLCDTVTTNTDMRGTDGANTTAPNNSDVAAIKVKTDRMIFTKTNELDVNVQSINGVTITGNGGSQPYDV